MSNFLIKSFISLFVVTAFFNSLYADERDVLKTDKYFVPPKYDEIPNDEYGEIVKWGRNIFINTQEYGKRYVGNGLNCSSCHLNEGRQAYAVPMWAAYGMYPMFKNESHKVVQITQKIQACFKYSMNGIAPTVDAPEMDALVTYFHWLSKGVSVGKDMPGRGLVSIKKRKSPSTINGEKIYKQKCAMCHGAEGKGQKSSDLKFYMFPPLWGVDSFNRKATLNKIQVMAQFIKVNMPLGSGFTLSDDEALDVSYYIWIHDRPEDPTSNIITNTFQPKPGSLQ